MLILIMKLNGDLISYSGGLEAFLTSRFLLSTVSEKYFGQWKVSEFEIALVLATVSFSLQDIDDSGLLCLLEDPRKLSMQY